MTITGLEDNRAYYFSVTAYDAHGSESGYASEVCINCASSSTKVSDGGDDGISDQDAFPNDLGEWLDTDGDEIGNNADTDDDNDGMPDVWEEQHGLNPLFDDSLDDVDRDGFSNLLEYQRQTDPNEPSSHPPRAMPWLPLLLAG